MEELYEELPGDAQEELYEDLPGGSFDPPNAYPYSPSHSSGAPPPLPTGPIPHRPGMSPPPLPTGPIPHRHPPAGGPPIPERSSTTTLSMAKTLPPGKRKEKQMKEKAATMKPLSKPVPASKPQLGGVGIDMNEILRRARQRSDQSAFAALESKTVQKDADDEHRAPWLNQLRKTNPAPKPKPIEDNAPPPWMVKRRSLLDLEKPDEEDVPGFPRRTQNRHTSSDGSDSPSSSPTERKKPPPPTVKPRVSSPPQEQEDKPAWMKQRERQYALAKMTQNSIEEEDTKPPTLCPKPAAKPPHISPKPAVNGTHEFPPPPAKKPRPVPAPRIAPKPANIPPPSSQSPPLPPSSIRERARIPPPSSQSPPIPPSSIRERARIPPPSSQSPPLTPSSIRERARTLERSLHGEEEPPTPPKPTPRSLAPVETISLPPVPTRAQQLPPSHKPPPPITSPPPPSIPPHAPPPIISPPSIPLHVTPPITSPPPPSIPPRAVPASQGEPTPPMIPLLKYHRRSLQSVNLDNPPPLPSRGSKFPTAGSLMEPDGPDEIYDDTLGLPSPDHEANGQLDDGDGPDELYDDVTASQRFPPPTPTQPPPSYAPPIPSQPPPSYAPPILSQPPPSYAPPIPSQPPPSKRPAPTPIEENYEMDETLLQNGRTPSPIPSDDMEQELYEDMNPEDVLPSPALPTSTSSSSFLAPPSPNNNRSQSPNLSPSLSRKKFSKDEKKAAKEEERREKERKRLEKEREKEQKRKDEIRTKNKLKGLKQYKEYKLPQEVQPLFAIEILLDHPKTKDHMSVTMGEVAFVLLINHTKLPDGKYLVEKDDGNIGYVNKSITQRTAYQSAQSALQSNPPEDIPEIPEDIYESLPQDVVEEPSPFSNPAPSLPPPNVAPGAFHFPPPSQPPPPPPDDGPDETYEYLPDEPDDFQH